MAAAPPTDHALSRDSLALLARVPEPVVAIDPGTLRIAFASASFCAVTGLASSDLVGMPLAALVPALPAADRTSRLALALADVARDVAALDDDARIFEAVCAAAVRTAGLALAWIGLVEPARRLRTYARAWDDRVARAAAWPPEDPMPSSHVAWQAIDGGDPASTEFLPPFADGQPDEAAYTLGLRAAAAVPLKSGTFVVGAFTCCATEARPFTPAEMALLGQIGAVVSARLGAIERDRMRLRREAALRRSQVQLRTIFERVPIPLLIRCGGAIEANPAFLALFGYRSVADLPDDLLGLVAPESATLVHELHAEARAAASPLVVDAVGRRRDGTLFPVEARLHHMELPEGDAIMLIVTEADRPSRDVSRRPRQNRRHPGLEAPARAPRPGGAPGAPHPALSARCS